MTEPDCLADGVGMRISNEFAEVEVRLVETPKGERLSIKSPALDEEIRLDAVALESLTWQDPSFFSALLEDPFGPATDDGSDR